MAPGHRPTSQNQSNQVLAQLEERLGKVGKQKNLLIVSTAESA